MYELQRPLEQERLKHDNSTNAMRTEQESLQKEVHGKESEQESLQKEVHGKESEVLTKLTAKDAEMQHQSAEHVVTDAGGQ